MPESDEIPVPGVAGLDHTADIGLDVRGSTLSELFERAALGAVWLVLERDPDPSSISGNTPTSLEEKRLELVEEELGLLLRSWLRSILSWAETEGFVPLETRVALVPAPLCGTPDGQAFGLKAQIRGVFDSGPRIREIKGVTFHGLRVEQHGEGWLAQVIFDV